MKSRKNKFKRPKSCHMKNIAINQNINKNIPINYGRIFSSKNFPKNNIETNKIRAPTQSPYVGKYKNQLIKVDMYKEMWDKSVSDEDVLGIAQTIQINPENFPNNIINERFKANATSTRKISALTYNDLNYKSKRILRNIKTNNKNNFWRSAQNTSNMLSTNTNKKIGANTILDIYHDKESFINFSNYNSTLHTNKNNINTDLSHMQINYETNLSNSYVPDLFNYGINKNRSKKNEVTIINESRKTQEDINDKNNFEKMVIENNNNNSLTLRTEYLIKFSKLLGIAKKFQYSMDFFRVEKRDIFSHYMKNLTMAFDSCNDFFINQIKEGDILDTDSWSKILLQYHNLSLNVIKFQSYAFQEMHYLKNENSSLTEKLHSLENELETKKEDINKINKYIIQYDLTGKVKYKKKKEKTIKEIKDKYNSQESAYVVTIHRLEQEIKQLTEVLNQNKLDVNNFNEVNEKFKKLKEEFEENKTNFDNQNSEKIVTIKVLTQTNIDLNEKINELEAEIKKFKDNEEEIKTKFIEYDTKIEVLNQTIKQKNNLIEQLKEENRFITEKNENENNKLLPVETVFISPKGNLRKKFKKET